MIGSSSSVRWILGERQVLPAQSAAELEEYLSLNFLIIEKSNRHFMQIVKQDETYYIEWFDRDAIRSSEVHFMHELWREVEDYVGEHGVPTNHPDRSIHLDGGCRPASLSVAAFSVLQFAIFLVMSRGAALENIFLNALGTLALFGVAQGLKSGRFFIQHADASYARSKFNFWTSAVVGILFGIAIIVLSYI